VLLFALALASLLAPEVVHAQEEYTASRKFGRGLAGMTLGFLEIPGNVVEESRNNGVLSGMTVGLAKGLGKCVTRELVGVYEFLTAPFAVPSDFTPVLEPEFPWQYFESGAAGIEDDFRGIPGTTVSKRNNGVVVTFSDELLFSTASSRLSPGASASLDRVAAALRGHPSVTVTVTGHTDDTGSDETNRQLSTARAEAVTRYLASRGLDSSRIVTRGLGDADPVASNATVAGRRLNRRVEIMLR
jgi:putative exosortase-associated protein (TIGR04073 family)